MIDTIAIMSPPLDMKTLKQLEKNVPKRRKEVDTCTGEETYLSLYGKVTNELEIPISYCILRINGEPKIRLESSVHKLMAGHNTHGGPKYFQASAAFLVGEFERLMGINLPAVMDWNVQRVDVEEFYKLKSQKQTDAWFRTMHNAGYPKRKIHCYKDRSEDGISIIGQTTVINFYNKGTELRQNKKDRKRLIRQMGLTEYAKLVFIGYSIIKVEVQIKRDKIKYDLGENPTVKDITDDYLCRVHDAEVKKFLKDSRGAIDLVRHSDQVYDRLRAFYKPVSAGTLFEFWLRLSRDGEVKTRNSMAKSSYNRYLKELRDAGVDWKVNAFSTPEYSAIPVDFVPVRGNKYHRNTTLDVVEQKLSPYLNKNSS